MDEDWWPDCMRDVRDFDPWRNPQVVVAEYRSFDEGRRLGTRRLWSVLVSEEELRKLDGHLGRLGHEVEANGPRPDMRPAGDYQPKIYIPAIIGEERIYCEPLVLGWHANNRTAMVLDPGFTMTYGLMSRAIADGTLHWDDLTEPEFDIAIVDPPSVYENLVNSPSKVVVSRDYLQDYLTLRGKHLIQVYYECRYADRDNAIEAVLRDDQRRDAKLRNREVDVMRAEEGGYFAQIWGACYVAGPGEAPISSDVLDRVGLVWPGLEGAITYRTARSLRHGEDTVYISDNVLGAYEGKPGFHVSAERGGVSYENQWGVTYTSRIGRDLIQIELRKLYEGAPARVIRHWHSYAVAPVGHAAQAEHLAPNVGKRARSIVERLVGLGESLADFSNGMGLANVDVLALIGLDPAQLEYEGWWSGPHIEPITYHIPREMTEQIFLHRCLTLDKVVNEPLSERRLRPMVAIFGDQPETNNFRGLKLLDRLVCLAQVASNSGLSTRTERRGILERLRIDGTDPAQPCMSLFALSDLRQVAGHRKEAARFVPDALQRFGIDPASTAHGWGEALDQIYDALSEQLKDIESKLRAATVL